MKNLQKIKSFGKRLKDHELKQINGGKRFYGVCGLSGSTFIFSSNNVPGSSEFEAQYSQAATLACGSGAPYQLQGGIDR